MKTEYDNVQRFLFISDIYFKLNRCRHADIELRDLEELIDAMNEHRPTTAMENYLS